MKRGPSPHHKDAHKVTKLGIGGAPIGYEARDHRRRESRQIRDWPKGMRFTDAEYVEPALVCPVSPHVSDKSSGIGNSSLDLVQHPFAKV
jgi:hypothetical protein